MTTSAFHLTENQSLSVEGVVDRKLLLQGPPGTGKTAAAVARLLYLLEASVPGDSILVIVPQRTLATPYYDALRRAEIPAGGQVTVLTIGGLAQRTVDLFWPLVVEDAGFGRPDDAPTFLTLETAQYYMARIVRPLLDRGYFESIVIDRDRLISAEYSVEDTERARQTARDCSLYPSATLVTLSKAACPEEAEGKGLLCRLRFLAPLEMTWHGGWIARPGGCLARSCRCCWRN